MKAVFSLLLLLLIGLYQVSSAMNEKKFSMTTYVSKQRVFTQTEGGAFPKKTIYDSSMPNKLILCDYDEIIDITGDDTYQKLIELCPERTENDPHNMFYVLEFVGERTKETDANLISKTCYKGTPNEENKIDLIPISGYEKNLNSAIRLLVNKYKPTNNIDDAELVASLDYLINADNENDKDLGDIINKLYEEKN